MDRLKPPYERLAKAAALAAFVVLVPNAAAHSGGIAGGHSTSPYACNPSGAWSIRENQCAVRRVFPRHLWRAAFQIVTCESGWDEHNVSPTADYGLFQINRWYHPAAFKRRMFDPVQNTRYARHLQAREGWRPWVCARLLGIH